MPDPLATIRELERQSRARAAIERAALFVPPQAPQPDAPAPSTIVVGELLELVDGSYRLDGRTIAPGDGLEVFTNVANGWVRGRFAWTGQAADSPRLAINLWDPRWPRDPGDLPPWVGELDAVLPARAICRRTR